MEGLDKVMSAGLGRRYAFIGPIEVAYLNADGMLDCIVHNQNMVAYITLKYSLYVFFSETITHFMRT